MTQTQPQHPRRGIHGILIAVAAAYALSALAGWRHVPEGEPGLGLLLAVGAGAAAWINLLDRRGRSPRLALTFVLAAFVLAPPPVGFAVALAAALAADGGAVAGRHGRGLTALAPLAAALAVAQGFAGLWFAEPRPPSVTLLGVTLAFLLTQLGALALGIVAGVRNEAPLASGPFSGWRPGVLELLNVPLAWLLASAITRGAWLQAVGIAGLTIFIGWSLVRLGRALRHLGRTNDALARRLSELGTLHAIGREILSTLDPLQVFAIVERECGKIFDVDACTIALVDRDTAELSVHYQRRRHEPAGATGRALASGPASAVAGSKRAERIDDCRALSADSPLRGDPLDAETRSVMAVPLIVKEQVVGVIVLESRAPGAYDEHQLSVLNTIAQQAAVAIENARNYQLATVDSLTGFCSRDYFFRRLEEEHTRVARYGGRFALLMLDLDGFKQINDRYGHQAGDRYLQGIAETVRAELRDADLPCRYGGDEFCVFLPETRLDGARVIAERIREAVAGRVVARRDELLRTTISIGVAAFPDHDPGKPLGLLRNADEALYRAKRAGRNCVVPFAA